jgi:Family of unknown function (DUF6353)
MKYIPKGVTMKVARQALVFKKNSPRLFFGAGIVGVIGGTVMACRATLKAHEPIDEMKKNIYAAKAAHEFSQEIDSTEQSKGEYEKELLKAYVTGFYHLTRLYGPAILVTGASVGLLTGAHVTLTRRNAALTAAYAAMAKSYEEYRERVMEKLGEDKELDVYHAADIQEIVDPEGKKVKALVASPGKWSPYARFFDEASHNWQKNPDLNRIFVQVQQNYTNDLLQSRGHVFLNEVYDLLGLERSQEGQVVGWVLDGDGDGFIDFGIFEAHNEDFLDGWEKSIILDFNVDGVIYDKI